MGGLAEVRVSQKRSPALGKRRAWGPQSDGRPAGGVENTDSGPTRGKFRGARRRAVGTCNTRRATALSVETRIEHLGVPCHR